MKQDRLKLYTINIKYVRDLAQKDDYVRSVSPQQGKENRPFVGIVIICDTKKYCIPLSSPKPKHYKMKSKRDLLKIMVDNKLIGVLNFNSMIPVDNSLIKPLDIKVHKNDAPNIKHYKIMTKKQLDWCQQNQDKIVHKANMIYNLVANNPDNSKSLINRCCDFKKLEAVLEKWLRRNGGSSDSENANVSVDCSNGSSDSDDDVLDLTDNGDFINSSIKR